ncbi:MAG TPA: rhodanese-like domain-containing protein [Magnetospirillaceae bacterium]|jgi:thiosulfate/3-mercaptopyruvate sulfurtransferase
MPYARPDALVSTEWLAGHLQSPGVRVVDASWFFPATGKTGRVEFEREHIAEAVFFDIDDIAAPKVAPPDGVILPHMMPDARRFAQMVGDLGLGNGNRIIIYDRVGGGSAAARVWFMFRNFGHNDVALLDGGLTKWILESRPVTADLIPSRQRSFTVTPRPNLIRDKAAMKANLTSKRDQVIDARSRGRFAGTEQEMWPHVKVGHIPGSRNVPWTELLDPETKAVLPAEAIAKKFIEAGITPAKPIVASCGSGVSACMLAFGLYLLGKEEVALYDGSWAEWGNVSDTPFALGEA